MANGMSRRPHNLEELMNTTKNIIDAAFFAASMFVIYVFFIA